MSADLAEWLVTPRYTKRDALVFAPCFIAGFMLGALFVLVLT